MKSLIFAAIAVLLLPLYAAPAYAQNSTTQPHYAALGDSIAAGFGLADTGILSCGRSTSAYPYKVAQEQNMSLNHLACSGATTQNVLNSQLNQAFANGTPGLITVTVGANDMEWARFLRKCVTAICGTREDSTETKALRTTLEQRYRDIFSEIQRRSGGIPPRVVITGYSNPISNYCKGRQDNVSNKEINWLNSQRSALNKTIRKAASAYPFVKYASTNFQGHALCSPESWVQQLGDRGALHPDEQGQQLIADSIQKTLKNKR